MTNDPIVDNLGQFTKMAESGFFQFVVILLGVTFVFWSGRIMVALFKRHNQHRRNKKRKNQRIAQKHDPNKWERDWEMSQREELKKDQALTPKQREERRKKLEEDRETYRLQRRNNQWKK